MAKKDIQGQTMGKKLLLKSYRVNMSKEEFIKILDYDTNTDGMMLFEILEIIEGISQIDYDGHFGPNVYLSLLPEFDDDKTWNEIMVSIKKVINN